MKTVSAPEAIGAITVMNAKANQQAKRTAKRSRILMRKGRGRTQPGTHTAEVTRKSHNEAKETRLRNPLRKKLHFWPTGSLMIIQKWADYLRAGRLTMVSQFSEK
jgi:hypothetical protein